MSSIAGFFHPNVTFPKDNDSCEKTIRAMSDAMHRRGPDSQEFYVFPHGRFSHNAMRCEQIHSGIPVETQPVTRHFREKVFTLLYDGFITNLPELKAGLERDFVHTEGLAQEEILLCAFLHYGADFVKKLSGAFAIAV